jgi:AraC family transcriptional activator of tynA and feaB
VALCGAGPPVTSGTVKTKARTVPVEVEWERALSDAPLPMAVRLTTAEGDFPAHVARARVDDVLVLRWRGPAFETVRGSREIAATDDDYTAVDVVERGRLEVRQNGRESQVDAGGAVAWDSRLPVRVVAPEAAAVRRLVFPRKVLVDIGCHLSPMEPAGVLPATTVLRGYLDTLESVLPELSGAPEVAARNALLELVWGALQPELPLDPQALVPARRAAVERYLDTHLGYPWLSAQGVAAAHHISPRTLGRLFEGTHDTFSGVVMAKRIARVREELLAGEATVVALARRWGFTDASHLNRRFRSVFGVSPTEYRAAARGASACSGDATPG